MNFKLTISAFLITVLLNYQSFCQSTEDKNDNYYHLKKNLISYRIDSCISPLLTAIVELDTNRNRFPPEEYFYSLDYRRGKDYREIEISPLRWEKSFSLDFDGIIKIGWMSFLISGNFKGDPIFRRTGNSIPVHLKKPKEFQADSVDGKLFALAWYPTLVGKYTSCKGDPISVKVFVGRRKLEGYEIR